MKKLTLNEFILYILVLLLMFLLIQSILTSFYILPISLLGFFFSWLLVILLEKNNLTKTLKYVIVLVSFIVVILLIYHIFLYIPYSKNNFYGYDNIEDFFYQFPYEKQNISLMILFGNFRVIFLADSFFIIVGMTVILNIGFGIIANKLFNLYLKNKKER